MSISGIILLYTKKNLAIFFCRECGSWSAAVYMKAEIAYKLFGVETDCENNQIISVMAKTA